VKVDGKEIKDMRDLPRLIADMPVGQEVAVVIIRNRKEEIKTVIIDRLNDGWK
jgi:serine protease Do